MLTNTIISKEDRSITFTDLLKLKNFKIPDYQRAYSWEEREIKLFINDLKEYESSDPNNAKKYYLGHFIFEHDNSNYECEYEIVDGQQRLTTIFLFMLVCKFITKEDPFLCTIKFKPVSYDLFGYNLIIDKLNDPLVENFETITNIHLENHNNTSSFTRMIEALKIFYKSFEEGILDKKFIKHYLNTISSAYCSFVVFEDKAVSSQVFELHNTRGLPLSETEKVKSTLMKMVYMHSTKENVQDNIIKIENAFSQIFQNEEKAKNVWFRGELSLDNILMYHLRAIEDGRKIEKFSHPQSVKGENGCYEYIKNMLKEKNEFEILDYCINLSEEFSVSMDILTNKIIENDYKNHKIGDSILLDRDKSLIFLLRLFRITNEIDDLLISRWENFLVSYELLKLTGYFYNHKSYTENFKEIYKSIDFKQKNIDQTKCLLKDFYVNNKKFAYHWRPIQEIFEERVDSKFESIFMNNIYNRWSKVNVTYILYKFELYKNADYNSIRDSIFKNNKVSIDHIVAQNLSWKNFGYENYESLNKDQKEQADIEWNSLMKFMNGIGNLSLSTSSLNSSDSNNPPKDHVKTYNKMGLVYTSELVSNWIDPKQFENKIFNRGNEIIDFIKNEFIFNKQFWEN
jgi:uncharacterized protein with ParB-like and HNH nuclease domain